MGTDAQAITALLLDCLTWYPDHKSGTNLEGLSSESWGALIRRAAEQRGWVRCCISA